MHADDEQAPHGLGVRPRARSSEECDGNVWDDASALTYALQASGLGHWRYDFVHDRFELSSGGMSILGARPEDEIRSFSELKNYIHPDDRAAVEHALRGAFEDSDEYVIEHRIITPVGEVRWVVARGRVCRARPDRPMMAGIVIDVTEHKQMEAERERLIAEVAAERARLRAIVEHLPAAVIVGDASGRVVLTNPEVGRVFPSPPLAVPLDLHDLYQRWIVRHADGRLVEPHDRPLARALRGETVVAEDYCFVQHDGPGAWVRMSSAPIFDAAGELAGAVVIGLDITERQRAGAEREALLRSLEQSEERYRLAALATDDEIYEWDIRADRVTVHRMFSHAHERIRNVSAWSNLIHPQDRERVVAGLRAALKRGDRRWQDEYGFAKGDGTWLTIVDRGYIDHDATGRPIRMIGAMQDVTARRRQEEFERQLIGIVSHDLKNPLNTILLAAGMVARSEELGERAVRNTVRIQGAAERAIRMIRDLLDFTRARLGGGIPIERRSVDLGALVRDLVEDMRVGHPKRAIILEASGDLEASVDPDRFGQVVTNLVENALKYSLEGSPVRVTLEGGAADLVRLHVHNDGTPIRVELLPRIFEPLTRGDSAFDADGRSVGLGLYIVRQLVTAHGGSVEVRSTEQGGTDFVVSLPRSAET